MQAGCWRKAGNLEAKEESEILLWHVALVLKGSFQTAEHQRC